MPGGSYFNPEWGYLATTPRGVRALRIVLASVAVAAVAGAGAYVSLLGQSSGDQQTIADRTIVKPGEEVAATPSAPAGNPGLIAGGNPGLGASGNPSRSGATSTAVPAATEPVPLQAGILPRARVAVPVGGAPVGEIRMSGVEFGHDSGVAGRRAVASSADHRSELAEAPAISEVPASTPQLLAIDDVRPPAVAAPTAALIQGEAAVQIRAPMQSPAPTQSQAQTHSEAAAAKTAAVQSSPDTPVEPATTDTSPVHAVVAPALPQANMQVQASAQKKPVKNQRAPAPASGGPLSLLRIFSSH